MSHVQSYPHPSLLIGQSVPSGGTPLMRPSAGLITEYETTCSWPLCYASLSWFYHVVELTNVWWQMMNKTNFGPTFSPPQKKKKIGQIIMKEVDLVVKCPVTQHFK